MKTYRWYLKKYIVIIKNATKRSDTKGERHHVFPRSIYGNSNNIVTLTYKEHFVCHHLLYLACKSRYGDSHNNTIRMGHAFFAMSFNRDVRVSSRLYSEAKRVQSNIMSLKQKGLSNAVHNADVKEKIRATLKEGYASGRIVSATLGKVYSDAEVEERCEKRRKTLVDKYGTSNPSFRKVGEYSHSDEVKEKIRQKREEQNTDPEKRKTFEEGRQKFKEYISKMSDEERRKMFASNSGKIWITNGVDSKSVRPDEVIPEGWKRGRTLRKKEI